MKRTMLIVPAALAITATSANAALVNGDFQAPDLGTDAIDDIVPDDWTFSGGSFVGIGQGGIRTNGPLADASRDQFFYMNQRLVGNGAILYQDTGIVIVEGFTYTLTADVGEQDNQTDDDLGRIGLYGSTAGTGTSFAELTDIDPGPTLVDNASNIGVWDTFQTQFTATAAQAGQTLGVYLGFGDGTGESAELNVSFDNVSVTVVPEPGSLALLGLGGLCLVKRRRRGA